MQNEHEATIRTHSRMQTPAPTPVVSAPVSQPVTAYSSSTDPGHSSQSNRHRPTVRPPFPQPRLQSAAPSPHVSMARTDQRAASQPPFDRKYRRPCCHCQGNHYDADCPNRQATINNIISLQSEGIRGIALFDMVPIDYRLDSGADRSVMTYDQYQRVLARHPTNIQLSPTPIQLYNTSTLLAPLGEVTISVCQFGFDTLFNVKFIVLQSITGNQCLIGADLINQLPQLTSAHDQQRQQVDKGSALVASLLPLSATTDEATDIEITSSDESTDPFIGVLTEQLDSEDSTHYSIRSTHFCAHPEYETVEDPEPEISTKPQQHYFVINY
jgi:hypothetical protein